MMLSISYYINPNTRALTSNYKNTVIKDKEAYNGAMSQHLLNPVEDLAQALKTPIKLAKGASLSRQNNSVNIAEAVSYTHLDVYKRQRSHKQNLKEKHMEFVRRMV